MLKDIYTILKYKLQFPNWYLNQLEEEEEAPPEEEEVPEGEEEEEEEEEDKPLRPFIYVDWYLGQDLMNGDDHILTTPALYIEFLPCDFTVLPNNVEHTLLQFNIHLITETVYGDERDMLSDTIGHQALETRVYQALHNKRTEILVEDTPIVYHESIVRKRLTPHTRIRKLVKSVQTFTFVQ